MSEQSDTEGDVSAETPSSPEDPPDLADVLAADDDETWGGGDAPGVAPAAVDVLQGETADVEYDSRTVSSRAMAVLGGDDADLEVDLDDLPDQKRVVEEVLGDVRDYFETYDGRLVDPAPDDVEADFFDFSYLERYEEVSRTWVNEPFAYVTVLYDPVDRDYRYRVVEPDLDEFESYVRRDLVEYLRNSLMYRDLGGERTKESVFNTEVVDIVAEHARSVAPVSLHKLVYYLRRDFTQFGPIDPIMRDPAVEDVSCDGADVPVYVYHRAFRDLETNVAFSADRLSSFAVRLAQRAGKSVSVSEPLLDASLPDGSRLQLTLGGEVATRGANFTIRKFSDVPFSPVDLVNWNTFSLEQMAYFWLAIESNKSLIFAGGTGSGKTSSMNAVSFFIPPNSKVVTIEDTREIDLPHQNWIQSVTRSSASNEGRGEVSMYRLLQSALRQRPEYILVGEIRTEERVALTFFQAMGTGHTAYTTMHADSIETVLNRLQNPPLSVPSAMIQDLDIVSIQTQTFVGENRVRRNQAVIEMLEPDETDPMGIPTREVFARDAHTDSHERVGESVVMAEIADERGWTEAELGDEIARREGILRFLIEEGIDDYRDVAAVIQLYQKDSEYVIDRIRERGYDLPEL